MHGCAEKADWIFKDTDMLDVLSKANGNTMTQISWYIHKNESVGVKALSAKR
jgi:hypothetical protein